MVVRPHAPPLTVEEYKNLPETGPRYQLVEGGLYMAPPLNRFHQDISRNLQGALDRYLENHAARLAGSISTASTNSSLILDHFPGTFSAGSGPCPFMGKHSGLPWSRNAIAILLCEWCCRSNRYSYWPSKAA
jgi:hypothetical protein